jgi:hypothetical protein
VDDPLSLTLRAEASPAGILSRLLWDLDAATQRCETIQQHGEASSTGNRAAPGADCLP